MYVPAAWGAQWAGSKGGGLVEERVVPDCMVVIWCSWLLPVALRNDLSV